MPLRPPTLGRMPESSAHSTRGSPLKCSRSPVGGICARALSAATDSVRRSKDDSGAFQSSTGKSVLATWQVSQAPGLLAGKLTPGSAPACGVKPGGVCGTPLTSTLPPNAVVVALVMLWQVTQRG